MSGFSSFPFGALPALLLPWYASAARPLPWRETREPYRVWISEIMLQQTRVAAVLGYYARFLSALPDVAALAAVEEERLLKLWEGLGYYSRARNLKRAAGILMREYGGKFPESYAALRALPGIGEYTAGAIASICFAHARHRRQCAAHRRAPCGLRRLCRRARIEAGAPRSACRSLPARAMRRVHTGADGAWRNGLPAQRRAAVRLLPGRIPLPRPGARHGKKPARARKKAAAPQRRPHGAAARFGGWANGALQAPGARPSFGPLGASECSRRAFAARGRFACGELWCKAAPPHRFRGIHPRVHARGVAYDMLPHGMCRAGRCRAGRSRLGGCSRAFGHICAALRISEGAPLIPQGLTGIPRMQKRRLWASVHPLLCGQQKTLPAPLGIGKVFGSFTLDYVQCMPG
jgi:hypothetical protein